MRRFSFRLHRLERLREMEKREAGLQLAAAHAVVDERRGRREAAERMLRQSEELWSEVGSGDSSPREAAAFLEDSRKATAVTGTQEREAQHAAENRERICIERCREHRVLEKLRERKWRSWLNEAAREEQTMLDELHLLQTVRVPKAEER
jgi:flagellar export protein FliJ